MESRSDACQDMPRDLFVEALCAENLELRRQLEERPDVPPEIVAQLSMNLELLDAADAYYDAFPAEFKARLLAMGDKRAHEQFVASLATLPPHTRDRIRRCVTWLAHLVDEVSPPPAGVLDPARRSPAAVPLQLASSPGFAATA